MTDNDPTTYERLAREPGAEWEPVDAEEMMDWLHELYADVPIIIRLMERGGIAHAGMMGQYRKRRAQ
jgi:hypothetical protein